MGIHLAEILKRQHEVFITSRTREGGDEHLKYIKGNAKDDSFLMELLKSKWDAIVDFMVYTTKEFEQRIYNLLESGAHYFYLSSARVFADSSSILIREESPRLLDTTEDNIYLQTEEYALSKAREENILKSSRYDNWTIIRPYITYAENRLQLGVLEKEEWLYRAIHGRSIVINEEILEKTTTLTYGADVSSAMSLLIGNENAKRESFNITTDEGITWGEVLDIYSRTIESVTGRSVNIKPVPLDTFIKCRPYGIYQIRYDRMYNRRFDNSKILKATGKIDWLQPKEGLTKCLQDFLQHPSFLPIDWHSEVIKDQLSKQYASLSEISGAKEKIKYIIKRFKKI